ncbi:MAG: MMPL family transporter [Polyangiales bacterium]
MVGSHWINVSPPPSAVDRAAATLARFSHRHAWAVILATLAVIALSALAMSRLEMRGDFLDLLPARSEGARLYRAAMRRMGGGSATLYVIVQSPDADANRRLVDTLEASLRTIPPTVVRAVEHGPEEAQRFFARRKWFYADVGDLEEAECELARALHRAQPGFISLDDETCAELRSDHVAAPRAAAPATPSPAPTAERPSSLPFGRFRAQIAARTRDVDRYPTGYFRTADGRAYLLILRVAGAGFGDRSGDALVARVNALVAAAHPSRFHPRMEVGLGGDVPNAIAERDSVVREAAMSFGLASLLILGGIMLFFRSPWSLGHIGLAMFTGVGLAYAVAWVAFGYLTLSTVSLGSIVAGNGINYAIVFLARYRERRGEGDAVEDALADASVTVRGGTWLSALAAAGAYGALMLSDFRCFSQFGLIGASGMLFCWCATMVVVPASITLVERLRGPRSEGAVEGHSAPIMGALGAFTGRHPMLLLVAGALLLTVAGSRIPPYLRDPWEYNLANLQSSGNQNSGAGRWSGVADEVFRANLATPSPAAPAAPAEAADQGPGYSDILLADRLDDALPLAEAVVRRDRERSGGRYLHHAETVWDALGGPPAVVARKLALLGQIRAHLDALLPSLSDADRAEALAWRPPDGLMPPRPDELPTLVRERYTERDGTFGTPVFVVYRAHYSPSDGRKLIEVANLTQRVRLADGRELPTASRATVFAEMLRALEADGFRATAGALGAVILVVLLATRRFGASVAVITTLLGGVVLTVGGAAWLGTRLNFLNFVALPLTFGIGVDYGINLYDRMKFVGGDPAAAVRSVGGAMVLCSFTTVVGYGALISHDNKAMQSFGRIAMAGELSCLVTAMFLMPAALYLLRPRARR